jgi:phosphoglycolate phosphatase
MEQKAFNYRHIIWDWNGTLLDDKWLCIESINSLLKARNIAPLDEERYNRIFRFPVREYYEAAGFNFAREPFEVPAMEFIRLYDFRKKECPLQPGAIEVLGLLDRIGCRQYLLSASESGVLEEMTEHFGIRKYFRIIKGLDNHYAHGKGELGRELAEAIGAPAGSMVMIGDTCHDQEVAELMGIDAILCSHGHFPGDRLAKCGTRMFGSLPELTDWISGSQSLH